jgi:hypothetical protein
MLDASRSNLVRPVQAVMHNGVTVWCKANFKGQAAWDQPRAERSTADTPPQRQPGGGLWRACACCPRTYTYTYGPYGCIALSQKSLFSPAIS